MEGVRNRSSVLFPLTTIPSRKDDFTWMLSRGSQRNRLGMHIGIIGSSGKVADRKPLTRMAWRRMKELTMEVISGLSSASTKKVTLVSGGSSWVDHMAVEMYLSDPDMWQGLILYLPAPLTVDAVSGICNYETKPPFTRTGQTLNSRHHHFSKTCYNDPGHSLQELHSLQSMSNLNVIVVVEPKGFKVRNSHIANNIDHLVALTVRDTIEGGTLDTWNKFGGSKERCSQLVFQP